MRKIRVFIWGFGAMGSGMAEMILKKKGIEIVGVCDRDEAKIGKDMYEILGADKVEDCVKNPPSAAADTPFSKGGTVEAAPSPLNKSKRKPIIIRKNPSEFLNSQFSILNSNEGFADIALLATDSFVKGAFEKIKFCVEKKMNVISTAEEMAYPYAQEPALAKKLDKLAKANGVTILGTGINPGFVLDLLIIALTGVCEDVQHIKAARINDLSPFGKAVMAEQGVGISVEEFNRGVKSGKIVGHVGFPESIKMTADALGWKINKIEQTREPIISSVNRKTKYAEVKPGQVAGCKQCGYGYAGDELKIELEHPQQIQPEKENINTGDFIQIKGQPNISLHTKPEIPGGIGTIAICVNMIPFVINAAPGLKTMLDLPIPRSYSGDMRNLIDKK